MGLGWLKEKGWAFFVLVAFVFCFCGRVSFAVEMSTLETPAQSIPFQDGENEGSNSEMELEDIDVEPYVWQCSLPSLIALSSPLSFTSSFVDCLISKPPESLS